MRETLDMLCCGGIFLLAGLLAFVAGTVAVVVDDAARQTSKKQPDAFDVSVERKERK